jgi:hypothetical protein
MPTAPSLRPRLKIKSSMAYTLWRMPQGRPASYGHHAAGSHCKSAQSPALAHTHTPAPGRPRVDTPLEPPSVATPTSPDRSPQPFSPRSILPESPTNFLLTTVQSPPPAPPKFQATPRRPSFEEDSPPRVAIEPKPPRYCPPRSPIARRTRSRINAHPESPLNFAGLCQAFSKTPKSADGFAYLCTAQETLDSLSALSVLDPATGEFLEHRQLRRDPRYKAKWDTSYEEEQCWW